MKVLNFSNRSYHKIIVWNFLGITALLPTLFCFENGLKFSFCLPDHSLKTWAVLLESHYLTFDRYTTGVCRLCSGLFVKKAGSFENKKIMKYATEKRRL